MQTKKVNAAILLYFFIAVFACTPGYAYSVNSPEVKDDIRITRLSGTLVKAVFNPVSDCIVIESDFSGQAFSCVFYDSDGNIIRRDFSINGRVSIKSCLIKKGTYMLLIMDKSGNKTAKFEVVKM